MTVSSPVLAAILAAGKSHRFGSDKRRFLLDDKPLLQHTLAKPLSLGMPTLLVLKPEDELFVDDLVGPWLGNERLEIVYAEHAIEGMGHSLSAAARAAGDYSGLLVMLADMPFVQTRTLLRLVDSFERKAIRVPRCNGLTGHPVLFTRYWFEQLAALEGDRGAKGIVQQNPAHVTYVDVDDPGIVQDIDHPPVLHERESAAID